MKVQKIKIGDIPAVIWGEQSNKIYIHVHGKMSCKEYAESFAEIAEKKDIKQSVLICQNMAKEKTVITVATFGMVCMILW